MTPALPDPTRLRRRLLDWYRTDRRDLPWRATRDPYAIWISEAMLQQTRVETVIPYWRRFLERLPTIADLAAAQEDDVLALWSGLGYYRRARALWSAARVIVREHGGAFPRQRDDVLALPGVGRYTAGAVLSIAFDAPEPLVDGNVVRVFSRLFGIDAVVGSPEMERACWSRAEELVPRRARERERGPGAWNQALMELGATLCTAREPRCLVCPLAGECVARRAGRTGELPRAAPKTAPIDVELEALWLVRDGRLLLQRRPSTGRMAGLWELPTRERTPPGGEPYLFPARFARSGETESLRAGKVLGEARHGITKHRIRLVVRAGRTVRGGRRRPLEREVAWAEPATIEGMALTGMTVKLLRRSFLPTLGAATGN